MLSRDEPFLPVASRAALADAVIEIACEAVDGSMGALVVGENCEMLVNGDGWT